MKKYDIEYSTQYTPEKKFLWEHGVKSSFERVNEEQILLKELKRLKIKL